MFGGVLAACSASPGSSTASGSDAPVATAPPDTTGTTRRAPLYVPASGGDGQWAPADPGAAGWSAAAIAELADFVGTRNSSTLIVLAGGRILTERYWGTAGPTTVQDIASCQKSVVSTLVGAAVDRKLLRIDDAVSTYLPAGWTNATPAQEGAITIRQLLTMTSGLDQSTLEVVAPPGTKWAYNTTAYQKLHAVVASAAAKDIEVVTRDWLWDPIGVSDLSVWVPRPGNGIYALDATGARLWGLNMTARDMARFGLLVQRKGSWDGRDVVPSTWFDLALAPSQDLNPDYGFLWWLLFGQRRGVPSDLVAALGLGDQKIYVCPSLDVVVTRQGSTAGAASETSSDFDTELLGRLVAARR